MISNNYKSQKDLKFFETWSNVRLNGRWQYGLKQSILLSTVLSLPIIYLFVSLLFLSDAYKEKDVLLALPIPLFYFLKVLLPMLTIFLYIFLVPVFQKKERRYHNFVNDNNNDQYIKEIYNKTKQSLENKKKYNKWWFAFKWAFVVFLSLASLWIGYGYLIKQTLVDGNVSLGWVMLYLSLGVSVLIITLETFIFSLVLAWGKEKFS